MGFARVITTASFAVCALFGGAVPSAGAAVPPVPGGGTPYTTLGCSAYKAGGVERTSQLPSAPVTRVDAVYIRTCLHHSGTRLYAETQWYSPHGGFLVGNIYANVQDCGTGAYGSYTYTKHNTAYYGPTTARTADKTDSGLDYGSSGRSYRAKGRMAGTLTVKLKYYLDDGVSTPGVSVASSCYRV